GIECDYLDRRVVDLGQSRDWQLIIGHDAGQQNRDHQQHRRDGPQNKWPGRIHYDPCAGGRLAVVRTAPRPGALSRNATLVPCRSLSTPSTTTSSPSFRSLVITVSSPSLGPTV